MNDHGDWGDISDAELLGIQYECLSTEFPGPSCNHENEDELENQAKQIEDTGKGVEERMAASFSSHIKNIALKRKIQAVDSWNPMKRFWRRHLSVTMLCEQSWCEMKAVYGFLKPQVRKEEMERTEVKTGATIHLARELEVHEVIPVATRAREDVEAIKFLNVLHMIPVLSAGQCVREFPVFGVLEGVFFMGVIDELSYNEKGELVLSELKTRRQNSLPGPAQTKGHCLQVGLYKLLFNSMIRGEVKRDHIMDHLKLQPDRALGAGILEHAKNTGVEVATFGELVALLLVALAFSDLCGIDRLQLEYSHQDTGTPIGTRDAPFEEALLRAELQDYLAYWKGHREPRGVDIEEAWKCKSCPYENNCDWRKDKSEASVTSNANKKLK